MNVAIGFWLRTSISTILPPLVNTGATEVNVICSPTLNSSSEIAESSDMSDAHLALLILGGGIIEMLDSDQLYAGGFQNIVDGILAAQNIEETSGTINIGISSSLHISPAWMGPAPPATIIRNSRGSYPLSTET